MKDFTSGTALATDHWGATGIAAMMDPIFPAFETAYPNNSFGKKYGDGAGQVFSEVTSGPGWGLTGLGLPATAAGISSSGTNLMGQDFYYQHLRDQLFLLVGGYWSSHTYAGVRSLHWNLTRTNANSILGFRSACYPV
jgi:hypothetical protein